MAVYSYFLASLFANQFLTPTLYHKETVNGTTQLNPVREFNISGDTWGPNPYTIGKRLGLENIIGNVDIHFYIPIFGILEFIFYNGWLRVAGSLLDPLGNDDDDFDMNYIIDRNLTLGYIIADHDPDHVEMEPDTFGEEGLPPIELPHTNSLSRDGAFGRKSYKKKISKPIYIFD